MSDRRVFLVGDSFGIQRAHEGVIETPQERTWPIQVQRSVTAYRVDVDFVPYRRFIEVPDVVAAAPVADLVIVQAGTVDCFPRPLPFGVSKSQHLAARIGRRALVRPLRHPWMSYVYRTTWSSRSAIESALGALHRLTARSRIGVITVTPALRKHSEITPMAQDAIFAFNDRLRDFVREDRNAFLIDVHAELLGLGYERYLSPIDGHLSPSGNDWLATRVLAVLPVELATASARA